MPRQHPISLDFSVAVLTEYDGDGFLGVQIDAFTEKGKGLPSYEAVHPFGFMSRPRDPVVDDDGEPSLGATTLRIIGGNVEHGMVLGDPRMTGKLPRLKKGGSVMYCDTGKPTPPFFIFDGDTGGAQLYIPYAATAMTIAIDVQTEGAESIQVVHGAGMGFSMTAGGDNDCILHNKAGDAFINVNDKGITLNGNTQVIGAVQLGAQATPLDPPPVAVALAPALQAYSIAMAAFLAQVAAAVNGLAPGAISSPPPTIAPTVAAINVTAS